MAEAQAITGARSRAKAASSSLMLVTVVLAFFLEALFFAVTANMNRDEGWYLLAGRLVYDGEVLYKDFPYYQGPLLPYIYGLPQTLFHSSILIGRLTALAMSCATIALVVYIAQRLSGIRTATWAVVFLAVTPMFMAFSVVARSEAAVIPLSLLALALTLRYPDGFLGFAGAPLALLLATAVRLTFFPAFVGAAAYTYWRARPTARQTMAGAALLIGVWAALYLPFLIADANATIFNLWSSQVSRANQFEPHAPSFGATFLDRIQGLSSYWPTFFLILVPGIAVIGYLVEHARAGWQPGRPAFGADARTNQALILGFAILIWAPHLALNIQEPRYFLPSFVLLSIVVADVLVRSHRGELGDIGTLVFRPLIVGLLAIALIFNTAFATREIDARDPQLTSADEIGTYLSGLVAPDERFVTLDVSLAIAADRDVAEGLEMGSFSFWPVLDPDLVRDYGLVNRQRLEEIMLAPETRTVVLTSFDIGIVTFASHPEDLDFTIKEPVFQVFPALRDEYRVVRTYNRYGQFQEPLYVLQRKR